MRAGHFSEGIFGNPKTCILRLNCSLWQLSRGTMRNEPIQSLQASQNELAEPFKYSNTLCPSSTIVYCIPSMRASEERASLWARAAMSASGSRIMPPLGISPAGSDARKTALRAQNDNEGGDLCRARKGPFSPTILSCATALVLALACTTPTKTPQELKAIQELQSIGR